MNSNHRIFVQRGYPRNSIDLTYLLMNLLPAILLENIKSVCYLYICQPKIKKNVQRVMLWTFGVVLYKIGDRNKNINMSTLSTKYEFQDSGIIIIIIQCVLSHACSQWLNLNFITENNVSSYVIRYRHANFCIFFIFICYTERYLGTISSNWLNKICKID